MIMFGAIIRDCRITPKTIMIKFLFVKLALGCFTDIFLEILQICRITVSRVLLNKCFLMLKVYYILGKVFKSGLSIFCGRQPLKNLVCPILNTLSRIIISNSYWTCGYQSLYQTQSQEEILKLRYFKYHTLDVDVGSKPDLFSISILKWNKILV